MNLGLLQGASKMKLSPPPPRWLMLNKTTTKHRNSTKIVSEYDQEIPQSQTANKHMAPRGRATLQSRDTRKAN